MKKHYYTKDYIENPFAEGMVTLTRRTDYPKLGWLITELENNTIACAIDGASFHAPILKVQPEDLDAAWAILDPVDDIPDNAKRYRNQGYENITPEDPDTTPIMEW